MEVSALSASNIVCPQCGASIALTEALTANIETSIRQKYEAQRREADERSKRKETDLIAREQALRDKEVAQDEAIAQQVAVKIDAERARIAEKERKRLQTEQGTAMAALEADLKSKDAAIAAMRQAELDLRKRSRELEEKAAATALENQRTLDAERAAIREAASKAAAEENLLKIREKDNLLAQMSEQMVEMKRRLEVGSQEAQGEALEQELQEILTRAYPFDAFEEVKKGVRGGDIVQVVKNASGKICGRILWESKNTKAFSKAWIEKVKADQMAINANVAVIMTVTLPDGLERFGLYENVWITDYKSSAGLTAALRYAIIEADKQRVVSENQDSLKDLLYTYLTSKEAQMKIMAVMDAFIRMKTELDAERRAVERIWASREKQIVTITTNFTGFFGSIEGLVGSKSLAEVPEAVAVLEGVAG